MRGPRARPFPQRAGTTNFESAGAPGTSAAHPNGQIRTANCRLGCRVAPLRAAQPGAAGAVARAAHRRAGPAGGDDRRHPLPRPRDPAGAGRGRPGPQARPGAARGLHRGHARGGLAAGRSGRARAGRRSHAAVGHRRRQGAAPGHRADLRRVRARTAPPGAQAPQCPRTPTCPRTCTPASSAP